MKKIYLTSFYGLAFIAFGMLPACEKKIEHSRYEHIYRGLSKARSTLDYPKSKEHLDTCKKKNLQPCMELVNDVLKAKNELLKIPHDQALDDILNTIAAKCDAQQPYEIIRDVCGGAAAAFYYFNTDADDLKILSTIKDYPDDVIENVFDTIHSWYFNRTSNDDWIDFITTSKIEFNKKVNLVSFFTGQQMEPSGLMLL